MILKKGSKGEMVKILQRYLNISDDGHFGEKTKTAVMKFQFENRIEADGIVGDTTWKLLQIASTDNSEVYYDTDSGLKIKMFFLDKNEYVNKTSKKEYVFLHHTAGWHNPYNTIKGWNDDNRGTIGTEFVIGGQSIKGNDTKYDGEVLQAFPDGYYAWHLGAIGKREVHTNSVGIELCNFGQIKGGKTWAGTKASRKQLVQVSEPFRGFSIFHRYSSLQLENSKKLLKHIAERDNIDIRDGLPRLIKKKGVKAFGFNEDAFYGRIKGLWTHTNTRKDKFDCSPQEELMDMLTSL
jgi:hypothetical protein